MYVKYVKRLIDLVVSVVLVALLSWIMILAAIAVRLTSPGPALYWSDRVGRDEKLFRMPKFRSMPIDTPAVATHLLDRDAVLLTPIGSFLRRSSVDELPQLFSILRGDMTFVGPRPALFNQHDLIELRRTAGVADLVPGITGLAQVNGRDELSIPDKVRFDAEYKQRIGFAADTAIIVKTILKVLGSVGVRH